MTKTKARANGDGDVFPRKNKTGKVTSYRGAYVGPDGKRRYVSGKNKEDARKALREARANADAGLVFDAGTLTVGEYLERWLGDVEETVRPSTFERYGYAIRPHVLPVLGRLKLKDLNPAHLRGFYRDRLDFGLSPATVHKLHVVLHKALKAAVSDGLIPRNAATGLKLPRVTREEIEPLTEEQARLLLETIRGDRLEALYVLALNTGMRQGELLALKWDDADLERGILRVRRTLTQEGGTFVLGEPKTRNSRRTIRLTSGAVEDLKAHRKRQLEERVRLGSLQQENGLVFASETGTVINPPNLRNRSFGPLLKRAGLPSIRFHDLRHTCATLLLGRNVNAKVVSEMLGHSSISVTLDVYSHLLPDMQEKAAEALEEAFS